MLHFAVDDKSKLASNAPRYPRCKIFDFLLGNIPNPLTRPHKLRIIRLAASGKAHSLRCSFFPHTTHFVELVRGPLSRLRDVPSLFLVVRGIDNFEDVSVPCFEQIVNVFAHPIFTAVQIVCNFSNGTSAVIKRT